jgi:hypothetical protein
LIQLRQWATDVAYAFPGPDVAKFDVGTGQSLSLRLVDPTRSVSSRHARLMRTRDGWLLKDLRSRNGISVEGGRPQGKFLIAPGMEIGIGDLALVAENQSLVRLRGFLGRLLGWGPGAWLAIDLALRAIRNAAYRRAQLVLVGDEDLVSVARQIHVRTTPSGAPFIVCGKRLYEADASVRVTATLTDASAALAAAVGGTVCVRLDRPPAGHEKLLDATLDALSPTQMYMCAKKASKAGHLVKMPIIVPKLSSREPDKKVIVEEYARDAIREFGAGENSFNEHERDWIANNADTFTEIEIATLRTVARNVLGGVPEAADRLGLPSAALRDWFARRRELSR